MICKKCGKYHPALEPCYYDLPHNIIVHHSAAELVHASDEEIDNELRRRGITALPHPNPHSPDYSMPVLANNYLSDYKRSTWRKYCLALLKHDDRVAVAG